jgi:hypothetical protein
VVVNFEKENARKYKKVQLVMRRYDTLRAWWLASRNSTIS